MDKFSWRYPCYGLLALVFIGALSLYLYKINYKFIESVGDNYSYELIAQSVFTSQPFKINVKFDYYDDLPIFHHQRSFPPLHPVFLAAGHFLFGKSIYVNFILTSVVGVFCALPVFWLGKNLADDLTGLLAAVLVVLSPELVQM